MSANAADPANPCECSRVCKCRRPCKSLRMSAPLQMSKALQISANVADPTNVRDPANLCECARPCECARCCTWSHPHPIRCRRTGDGSGVPRRWVARCEVIRKDHHRGTAATREQLPPRRGDLARLLYRCEKKSKKMPKNLEKRKKRIIFAVFKQACGKEEPPQSGIFFAIVLQSITTTRAEPVRAATLACLA